MTVLDSNDDKLNWIFMAFDQDGGGFIDVNEIRDIVTCLFRWFLGWKVSELCLITLFRFAKMEEDQDLLQACVEDLQSIIDKDGDGDISRDEFVKNAANCKFITNLLSK